MEYALYLELVNGLNVGGGKKRGVKDNSWVRILNN